MPGPSKCLPKEEEITQDDLQWYFDQDRIHRELYTLEKYHKLCHSTKLKIRIHIGAKSGNPGAMEKLRNLELKRKADTASSRERGKRRKKREKPTEPSQRVQTSRSVFEKEENENEESLHLRAIGERWKNSIPQNYQILQEDLDWYHKSSPYLHGHHTLEEFDVMDRGTKQLIRCEIAARDGNLAAIAENDERRAKGRAKDAKPERREKKRIYQQQLPPEKRDAWRLYLSRRRADPITYRLYRDNVNATRKIWVRSTAKLKEWYWKKSCTIEGKWKIWKGSCGNESELDQKIACAFWHMDCMYCGARSKLNNGYINGSMDRIDSSRGYEINNIVPACQQCNVAKGLLSPNEYVSACVGVFTKIPTFTSQRSQNVPTYTTWCKLAKKRNIENAISESQYTLLLSGSCGYCDLENSSGIDRIRNYEGYTTENTVSCCKTCNRIKKEWSLDEFKTRCALIAIRHLGPERFGYNAQELTDVATSLNNDSKIERRHTFEWNGSRWVRSLVAQTSDPGPEDEEEEEENIDDLPSPDTLEQECDV